MAPPAPIDLTASEALRVAGRAVSSMAVAVLDVVPSAQWPDDATIPALAGWLASGQVSVVAGWADGRQVLEWYAEVQDAADKVADAAERGQAEVYVPEPCGRDLRDDKGRVVGRCEGRVTVIEDAAGRQTVRCSKDPSHAVPVEVWLRAARSARPQRRPGRALAVVTARLRSSPLT